MKIKIQQLDNREEKEILESIWDFSEEGYGYYEWFLWLSNDPPDEMRITCETKELRDAMIIWWTNRYGEIALDGTEVLYQEGDSVFGINSQEYDYRLRTFISPELLPA